jgi:hypothetical protein
VPACLSKAGNGILFIPQRSSIGWICPGTDDPKMPAMVRQRAELLEVNGQNHSREGAAEQVTKSRCGEAWGRLRRFGGRFVSGDEQRDLSPDNHALSLLHYLENLECKIRGTFTHLANLGLSRGKGVRYE